MANKLRQIFSNKNEIIKGKIHFSDRENAKKFNDYFSNLDDNQEILKIAGVEKVEMEVINDNNRYVVQPLKNVIDISILPNFKIIDFKTEYRTIKLYSCTDKNRIIIFKDLNSALTYQVVLDKQEHKISYSFNCDLKKAKTVLELHELFIEALDFFCSFVIEDHNEEAKNVVFQLKESVLYFERLVSLEKALDIIIQPVDLVKKSSSDDSEIELFYLICKKEKVRTNKKLNNISQALTADEFNSNFKAGMEIALFYKQEEVFSLFNNLVKVYTQNIVFNCLIDKIEEKNDKQIIYFTEPDGKQMYTSVSGFLAEDEVDEEMQRFNEVVNDYKEAKTINDLLKEDFLCQS